LLSDKNYETVPFAVLSKIGLRDRQKEKIKLLVGIVYCLTQLVQTSEDENEPPSFTKIQFVCFQWEKKVLLLHAETIAV
jgi:hypothetical protein